MSFALTTSSWTATYRKVQMLTAVALYTDFTKEFFTFRMLRFHDARVMVT